MTDLPRLSGTRFLVLGRAGMDFYAEPPGTQMEHARAFVAHLGGSAANIAATLSRLGKPAGLVSRVSDDAVGRFVLAELDRYGIDRSHVGLATGGVRTSLAVVETRAENCQSVIYRNGAADFELGTADIETVTIKGAAALVVTGTALAMPGSRAATMAALARARAAGVPSVIDLDYRPYSWASETEARAACLEAARACDIVVGNDDEFGLLAGSHAGGLSAARSLVTGGVSLALYKMGARGAVAVTCAGQLRAGVFQVPALKPTGAGDAFLGAFLAAMADGHPLHQAMLRGAAAAAIVVCRVGCAPASPTPAELDAFLQDHPAPKADAEAL